MKNSILNLGKALNKAAQKDIFGGLEKLRRPDFCDNQVTEIPRKECLCRYFNISCEDF